MKLVSFFHAVCDIISKLSITLSVSLLLSIDSSKDFFFSNNKFLKCVHLHPLQIASNRKQGK